MPTVTSKEVGRKQGERSQRRGYAFAPAKFQPDRKHVSNDGAQRGQTGQRVTAGKEGASECHGGQSLEGIENQREDTQDRR